jgi:hypothetical protein
MVSRALGGGARKPSILLAAVLVIGFGSLGSLYLLTQQNPSPREVSPGGLRPFMAIFDPGQPLMIQGAQTTLSRASTLAGFPVYRPKAPNLPLPEVWFSDATGEVALRYGSELVVLLTPWPPDIDPAKSYADKVAAIEFSAYTATINGNPAWVIPEDPQSPAAPNVSVVHVTLSGIEITLYGRMTSDRLISVAATVGQ